MFVLWKDRCPSQTNPLGGHVASNPRSDEDLSVVIALWAACQASGSSLFAEGKEQLIKASKGLPKSFFLVCFFRCFWLW